MPTNLASEQRLQALCTFDSWSAFQAYPYAQPFLATPHVHKDSPRRRWMTATNRARNSRRSCPVSCFEPDTAHSEPRIQLNRHEDEPHRPFLPSAEFASILTLVVTVAAGGPVLATWGLFFLILGNYTGTPPWLQALSTFLCASITDTLSYNWASTSLDSGYTPFVVFLLGSGAAALYESASGFPSTSELNTFQKVGAVAPASEEDKSSCHDNNVNHQSVTNDDEELADWDQAFKKTHGNQDTDG